jgi:DnaJ-class molecular chaperone
MLTVPKGANSGTVLRLKGKGVAKAQGGHGDQYVTLKVVLPDKPDPELEEFIARWSKTQAYDPRRAMEV